MIRIAILALLLCAPLCHTAGKDSFDSTFAVTAIYDGNVVHLRWAPGSLPSWSTLMRHGALVFRHDARHPNQVALNDGHPVLRWDSVAWHAASENDSAMAQAWAIIQDSRQQSPAKSDYSVADFEMNRMTLLLLFAEFNPSVARALGLAFVDSTISKNTSYRYSIAVPFSATGDTLVCETFVETNVPQVVPPVIGLRAKGVDEIVQLSWSLMPSQSAYHIERSEDGESWNRITLRPFVSMIDGESTISYSDSVENFKLYYYRVIAIDAFGRESRDAVTVSAIAVDRRPPQPPLFEVCERTARGARLEWLNPSPELDLAGYGILRSESPEDGFVPVNREPLSRFLTTFEDSLSMPGTYFYSVVAIDTSGNISPMSARQMIVVQDTVAPRAPLTLEAMADSNGVVKLKWSKSPEQDIAGYRAYRKLSDASANEWLPIFSGAIKDTFAFETLKQGVQDEFEYSIRSQDAQGNLSQMSKPIRVRQPDLLPPSAPVLRNISVSSHMVTFDMVSASRDVSAYKITRVLRRDKRSAPTEFETDANVWSDSTLEQGEWYGYSFAAIDHAGNQSPVTGPIPVRVTRAIERLVPDAPVVRIVDAAARNVQISWRLPGPQWNAIVYRRVGASELSQLSPLLTEASLDDHVRFAGDCEYRVRLVSPDGVTSEFSPSTVIRIE